MEYAGGGDLLHNLKENKIEGEQRIKEIFKQVVHGLAHCHCRSVLHRDVKLDNILIDDEGGIKICDFGVSKIIKKSEIIFEQCGTPAYLAPEIIEVEKTGYAGFTVDIWSLGVCLYALLCRTVPYKANSLTDLIKLINTQDIHFPDEMTLEASDIVQRMLMIDPS